MDSSPAASMTAPLGYHESLPYIDIKPSTEALAAARALIDEEVASFSPRATPPPAPAEPSFTPAMQTELARVAAGAPPTPLDLARYEAPSDTANPADALPAAAVSHSYLSSRLTNLALLDRYGKNAWLLGNHALEAELQSLERDLAQVKRDVDLVNLGRRDRQEEVAAEVVALEQTWRAGVGRVLETEVAVEELRAKVREELGRKAAQGGQQ